MSQSIDDFPTELKNITQPKNVGFDKMKELYVTLSFAITQSMLLPLANLSYLPEVVQ